MSGKSKFGNHISFLFVCSRELCLKGMGKFLDLTLLKREMVLGHHFLKESEAAEPDRQRQVCSSVESLAD